MKLHPHHSENLNLNENNPYRSYIDKDMEATIRNLLGKEYRLKITVFAHSLKCTARQQAYGMFLQDWLISWPKHCKECQGTGVYESGGDSVPYGSTYVSLPTYDEPCEECIMEGKCPRCSNIIQFVDETEDYDKFNNWIDERGACPSCNWKWGDNLDDYPPLDAPDCFCYENTPRYNLY